MSVRMSLRMKQNKKQQQKKQPVNKLVKQVAKNKPKSRGLFDARRSLHLARPLHAATPYVVVRHKQLYTFPINHENRAKGYGLWCPWDIIGDDAISTTVGILNDGPTATINAPVVHFYNPYLGADGKKKARTSKITVQVQVFGSPSGAIMPVGMIGLGTLRTPLDYKDRGSAEATPHAISDFLFTRNEITARTAYSASLAPMVAHCVPLDYVTYDEFKDCPANDVVGMSTSVPSDAMAPIVLCWQGFAVGQSIVVSLHTEHCVMYTESKVLQSAATVHPVASHESFLQEGFELLAGGGAVVASGASALARVGRPMALGAVRAGARALPALMM